jgi:hypothetical protein
MKFPDRSTHPQYILLDSSNDVISLGLQLNGITNHPTWARAFEVVRVKRIKNILFQTPVIPMTTVAGVGAVYNYPSRYTPEANKEVDIPDAQPQTASSILVPKNLFWPETRKIDKNLSQVGTGTNTRRVGEAQISSNTSSAFTYSMIFPSPSMYGDTPFTYTGGEKLDFIDYALVKVNVSQPASSKSYIAGDDINTNISGNFYALHEAQYFFDAITAGKSISSTYKNLSITDYEFFDNLNQTRSLSGVSVMDYDSLQTTGLDWGFKPNIQKSAVVKLTGQFSLTDIASDGAKTFRAATLNAYSAGGFITSQNVIRYESSLSNKYVNTYSGYTTNTFVGAIGIANVYKGLDDTRYGDINTFHEYISTGAKYTFSESEVSTLQAGGSVSKNIEVWGGDCFVGPQLFKVSDSTYSVVNQAKNTGSADSLTNSLTKWGGKVFLSEGSAIICQPIAVENASQYVQVILESEYNGEVREPDTVTRLATENGMPIYNISAKESMRVPISYRYNLNLSKQNDRKIFVPKPLYSFEQNEFQSRIAYSDIKIYNSDQIGFDVIRVGNIYDLEESRRAITKLAVAGDNLYAIQEQGIVYIPTGERQIETTDAGALAVRSGDVIGRPITIDARRGSQHLGAIVEAGNLIYIPDNINKSVYILSGQELKPITTQNESLFRSLFGNKIPERNVLGVYDPIRKEYWLVDNLNNRCEVFNEEKGWIANYEFTGLDGGVYTNQNLYLIGRASNVSCYTMYTGTVNQLFGITVVPRVTFCINPDSILSKTFDDVMIAATERLLSLDITVEREASLGNQTMTTVSLDTTSIEGNFRVKTLRDSSSARMRGLRALATIKWNSVQSAIQSVATKYRLSARTPW